MSLVVSNAINTVERLEQRVACNRADPGSFRRFVQRLLAVRGDDLALDLGAGLGEQLIPVAQKAARAVGLDVSAEIVEALRPRLPGANAAVVLGDMDELAELDLRGPFTLAYSVYSVYYSRDPARLVRSVAGLLAGSRARFVVVAPEVGNNQAWYSDLGTLFPLPAPVLESPGVCRNVVLPAFLDVFPDVRCATLREPGRLRQRGRADALLRRLRALLSAGAARGSARLLRAQVRAGRRVSDLQARARIGREARPLIEHPPGGRFSSRSPSRSGAGSPRRARRAAREAARRIRSTHRIGSRARRSPAPACRAAPRACRRSHRSRSRDG